MAEWTRRDTRHIAAPSCFKQPDLSKKVDGEWSRQSQHVETRYASVAPPSKLRTPPNARRTGEQQRTFSTTPPREARKGYAVPRRQARTPCAGVTAPPSARYPPSQPPPTRAIPCFFHRRSRVVARPPAGNGNRQQRRKRMQAECRPRERRKQAEAVLRHYTEGSRRVQGKCLPSTEGS